jgi:hypothetical protein
MCYFEWYDNFESFVKSQQKIFTICLFFIVPHFVVAQTIPFSIGLGSSLNMEFANNTTNTTNTDMVIGSTYYYHNKNKYFDGLIDTYLALDFKWLEASIGFWWGSRSIISDREGTWTPGTSGNTENNRNGGMIGGWLWNIFLKTPSFGRMMWFPMLGIESRIMTWIRPGDDANPHLFVDNHQTWNNLWFKFGFGFDRKITENLFAYMEFLLGFRGNNQYEEELQKIGGNSVDGIPVSISAKFTMYYNIQ